jgi:DNA-binding response OmpR family regulator
MNRKVLVIEDEQPIIELLKINMVRRGYHLIIADTGEEGLEQAFAHHPEAALLDVRLPGIDGWEVCRRLRENPATANMCIVFLTAAAQQSDKQRASECGADYFLAKPFDIAQLLDILGRSGGGNES